MNSAIKALEAIGQNTSMKEHDSVSGMLHSVDMNTSLLNEINLVKKELVCGLVADID